jgi:hypothetical protein
MNLLLSSFDSNLTVVEAYSTGIIQNEGFNPN